MLKMVIDCRMCGSGGIGSFISELIPYFLEQNECLLIGTSEQISDFMNCQNANFCFCDVKPFSKKELFAFPREVLKKINSYDCFFTPYINIPNGIKIPIFSTIHDVVFLDEKELTNFVGRLVRKYFYQRAINISKAIFTVSEFSKSRILKNLKCKKEIQIIYNAAPSYLLNDEKLSYTQKENRIIFVGNIKKHKGLKTLLDAFETAQKKGLTLKLTIVGNKDNFRTGDEQTVKRLEKIDSGIEFTGKISNSKLKELYATSKVLVQPSTYEGFGMPPLEAMIMGTPAIISDIPVFKEIYSKFPVTFFHAGDSKDLAEKLLEFERKGKNIDLKNLKNLYSYKRSYELIIDIIKKYL
ncbi:glycosyltransferase family 4 protein [Treponema pectinovorum]|uniref:glycosyltransferase family 4 protein n=1 Tax=Treponema pectinovorum TaxID=164 RepID=UPI0011CA01E6|nr:glycosyltransferase family 1 protein [Treponema pectinovorum]